MTLLSSIASQQIVPFVCSDPTSDVKSLLKIWDKGGVAFPLSFRLNTPLIESLKKIVEGVRDSEAALYILTSASTAQPKIVRLSMDGLKANAKGAIEFLNLTRKDRFALSLPLFHVGGIGIVIRSLLTGGELLTDQFDGASRYSFVPVQLKRFLKNPTSSSASILVGGQTIPHPLCQKAQQMGFEIVTTYGMSEMGSMITANHLKETFHMGTPIAGRALKIAHDGEILVKGTSLFLGYLNHPSPVIDGWLPTRDLGYLKNGHLHVMGRKDRQFISGGENIHPETIERALHSLDWIKDAKVKPIADEEFGLRPCAFIHPFANIEKTLAALSELLPKHLLPVIFKALEERTKLSG